MKLASLVRSYLACGTILFSIPAALAAGCSSHRAAPTHANTPAKHARVLRHVVLFKFKADARPDQVQQIENLFALLPSKIPAIIDFEWGTDVGVEDKADGFTHAFLVTFANEAGRDSYLPHPEHQAFVAALKPQLEKALVVDYWARR